MNKAPKYAFAALLLATIVLAAGCSGESQDSEVSSPQAGIEQPVQAPPSDEPVPDEVSAKHILVQYEGSMQAPPSITRTQEEALTRMQECLKKAREDEKFEDLALEYSDGPSGPDGGDLGEFPEGAMHPAFEKAAFACEVGKITEIVETPFGYHIIYRYK